MTIRIAICADLDLGVIDGATVWLASLAQVLSWRNHVTIVTRTSPRRDVLTRTLGNVEHVVHPRLLDGVPDASQIVIVRGAALCRRAARRFPGKLWAYLTDIPQRATELTSIARAHLSEIAAASRHVLCQTEAMRAYLESYIPGVDGKAILLPPMIPDAAPARAAAPTAIVDRPLRLGYAGKLAPAWRTLEMVEAVAALRAAGHAVELHVVGDKIFGPPGWTARMHLAVTTTPGVIWHRGRARDEALALLAGFDLALGIRGPELDDSLELSTKLLEYGAVGVPALLNRNPMHEELLGADYPLYADPADLPAAILRALDPDLRRLAAARGETAARAFTFSAVAAQLQPWLSAAASGAPVVYDLARPKVAGADRRVGLLDPTQLDRALAVLPPGHRLHVRGSPSTFDPAVSVDGRAPLAAWLRKIGCVVTDDAEAAMVATASGARTMPLSAR